MKNSSYWRERFLQYDESQNNRIDEYMENIATQYRKAEATIEGQINTWYNRFAVNNNMSLSDARKWLNASQLRELKWDVNDYIKYAEENQLNGSWVRQLENASTKARISRLQALELQMEGTITEYTDEKNKTMQNILKDVYSDNYYHTAYEIQKGIGVGHNFATLNEDAIWTVINKPWAADGMNFSERIWQDKDKLINTLHNELTQNLILGQDPQKAINAIAKAMNTSKNNAGRLVMTESAYFSSVANENCYKELDVEEYEIVATLDNRTSEICQSMDGQHFPMKDYEAGVTAPPFHVNCRSTTCPYFEDNDDGERFARDENGDTYKVPADMTYEDWKNQHVDNNTDNTNNTNTNDTSNASGAVAEAEKQEKQVETLHDETDNGILTSEAEIVETQNQIKALEEEQYQLAKGYYDASIKQGNFKSIDTYLEAHPENKAEFIKKQSEIDQLNNKLSANNQIHTNDTLMYLRHNNYIEYNEVEKLKTQLSENEIIEKIAGGDCTIGSCVSAGWTYIANKAGYDVLDFRGGYSQDYFSRSKTNGILNNYCSNVKRLYKTSERASAKELLQQMEAGKEYFLIAGEHGAITRKIISNDKEIYQYLELQCGNLKYDGWQNFNDDLESTLKERFNCCKSRKWGAIESAMACVDDIKTDGDFQEMMGYINTEESKQKKKVRL